MQGPGVKVRTPFETRHEALVPERWMSQVQFQNFLMSLERLFKSMEKDAPVTRTHIAWFTLANMNNQLSGLPVMDRCACPVTDFLHVRFATNGRGEKQPTLGKCIAAISERGVLMLDSKVFHAWIEFDASPIPLN